MFASASPDRPTYLDPETGRTWPLDVPRWSTPEGDPLMISELPGIGRDDIDRNTRSIWRYRASLPVEISTPITLGEGCTPLVESTWADRPLLFKLEGCCPSGSFKDRGVSVMLSTLRRQGVRSIREDSSGNGGASVAAYAAAGGLSATILVPEATPEAKVLPMRASGAQVERVAGPRQAAADLARTRRDDDVYASHNWQPLFLQGAKTLAYELWEDLGFRVPDAVIMPAGAGSNVLGCDIGFHELLRRGQIERLPRLLAVQPRNCSPLAAAWAAGAEDVSAIPAEPTIAQGTAITAPVRGREVLAAIRRSGGAVATVSEDEIAAAVVGLARMGFYVEPTAAVAAAGIEGLATTGALRSTDTAVVLLTGSGLKTPDDIASLLTRQ